MSYNIYQKGKKPGKTFDKKKDSSSEYVLTPPSLTVLRNRLAALPEIYGEARRALRTEIQRMESWE